MLNLQPALDNYLSEHEEELIAFRRHLHTYPELSGVEFGTTAYIAEHLQAMGLSPRILNEETGLICDIGTEGPLVALRAEIDGLAMQDEKEVAYRSKRNGIAHACGHDVHTAIVFGAGRFLRKHLDGVGRVRLIFQPAEESSPGGATTVIEEGGLEDVSYIFGLHCDPKSETGTLGVKDGPITMAADVIEVNLHGPGGHTARPERTIDIVRVASQIATDLPDSMRRKGTQLNVVFGAIHAGEAPNVIPSTAMLRGTVRTPDIDEWHNAHDLLNDELQKMLKDTGATFSIEHQRGIPPVVNDEEATEIMAQAARQILGESNVVPTFQSKGGDDYAWYLERVRGSYARLGVHDPNADREPFDLHASEFDIDERAIAVGVRVLSQTAIAALTQ